VFFVLEGPWDNNSVDNSPAIYRWVCREIHERVLEGWLKLAVRWLKFSRPSRTRKFYRSFPSDKSLGYYQLSLPGQPDAHTLAIEFLEEPEIMGNLTKTKRLYVGNVMAEMEVSMTDQPEAWGPHIDPVELDRIDAVRKALKSGDFETAAQEARLYSVKPMAM